MDYNTYTKAVTLEIIVQSEEEKAFLEHLFEVDAIKGCRVITVSNATLRDRITSDIKSSKEEAICMILNCTSTKDKIIQYLIDTFAYNPKIAIIKQKQVKIYVWKNKKGVEGFYEMLTDGIVDNKLSQSVRAAIQYNREHNVVTYDPRLDCYVASQTYLLWQRDPMNSLKAAIEDGNIDVSNIFTQERSEIKLMSSK